MHEENGHPKVVIGVAGLGPGWIYIEPQEGKQHEDLPYFVNRAFIDWQKDHPGVVIRNTLGIVADGATVGLHVWFDEPSRPA